MKLENKIKKLDVQRVQLMAIANLIAITFGESVKNDIWHKPQTSIYHRMFFKYCMEELGIDGIVIGQYTGYSNTSVTSGRRRCTQECANDHSVRSKYILLKERIHEHICSVKTETEKY